ncbi:MAG TPA: hypothetical protein PKG60_08105 [Spirochaetota bacterium]|nr:hypothetical protein [Spirochaetota bacterium]HPS88283.1 hypothetical protein [Spirochaetota bacterium]
MLPQRVVVKPKVKPYSVKITAGYTAKFEVEGIDAAGGKKFNQLTGNSQGI